MGEVKMASGEQKEKAFEERHGIRFTKWGKSFWDGTSQGELLFQQCKDCGNKMYPARIYCTNCMSQNVGWEKASGKGKIYSYSVAYEYPPARVAAFLKTPYIIALVDLEEGVRMVTNIEDCKPEDVKIGLDVKVKFVDIGQGVVLPKFKPTT
jgi:uncharacterized protein